MPSGFCAFPQTAKQRPYWQETGLKVKIQQLNSKTQQKLYCSPGDYDTKKLKRFFKLYFFSHQKSLLRNKMLLKKKPENPIGIVLSAL